MLVEFFGLPGAGKSTLSHSVARLLLAGGNIIEEPTYELDHNRNKFKRVLVKLASILGYVFLHPVRASTDVARILATQQASLTDTRRAVFNWLYIASVISRAQLCERIIILDQGLAQAVWSVGLAARRRTWHDLGSAAARSKACRPDLIINVKAEFHNVSARLALRESRISRIDHLGNSSAVLCRAQDHADAIVETFKCAAVMMLEVDNDSPTDLASTARRIADAILALKKQKGGEPYTECYREHLAQAKRDDGDCRNFRLHPHRSGGRL